MSGLIGESLWNSPARRQVTNGDPHATHPSRNVGILATVALRPAALFGGMGDEGGEDELNSGVML